MPHEGGGVNSWGTIVGRGALKRFLRTYADIRIRGLRLLDISLIERLVDGVS
jgi:hypothetical protein